MPRRMRMSMPMHVLGCIAWTCVALAWSNGGYLAVGSPQVDAVEHPVQGLPGTEMTMGMPPMSCANMAPRCNANEAQDDMVCTVGVGCRSGDMEGVLKVPRAKKMMKAIAPRIGQGVEERAVNHPAAASLIADFDHDGHVGSSEINQIKENLHRFFDIDHSGTIDSGEIKSVAKNDKEVQSAFSKLDRDRDSVISLQELDERWEAVGAEMTVHEVADWVTFAVQLPQYADMFRKNSISGYTFPLLMQDDGSRLQEIGVEQELHRQQLALFLRMKYLGLGHKPSAVTLAECESEHVPADGETTRTLLHFSWEPRDDTPLRYQLQARQIGEAHWKLIYTGPDTEFVDVVDNDMQHAVYRLTAWNSYGRSARTFIRCDHRKSGVSFQSGTLSGSGDNISNERRSGSVSSESGKDTKTDEVDHSWAAFARTYLWWWDEAIAVAVFVLLPLRGLIYGDANFVLRIFRRLPPNMPTRVTVAADTSRTTVHDAAVTVSWEKPVDNGVPIVCYCVRWTHLRTEQVKWLKLLPLPLATCVSIEHLRHGETYKFVVEATNEFGLVTKSSRSTYMVPVPELKGKLLLPQRSIQESAVQRGMCFICQDPEERKRMPFTATLNRHILHFCSSCDREFCHYHKGEVFHTKASSCPAVDGRCLCRNCKNRRDRKAAASALRAGVITHHHSV